MQDLRSSTQQAAEDIFFGQEILIWARWFVIAVGFLLVLSTITEAVQLAIAVIAVALLMVMNFYLHGRYLMERPAGQAFIVLASLLDLLIITAIVFFWPGGEGLESDFFVSYYAIVAAFGFVFPRRIEAVYTASAGVIYGAIVFLADPSIAGSASDLKTLGLRVVALWAVGGLANYYFRILRERRRAVVAGSTTLQELSATT